MEWVDLVAPAAAIFSVFVVVGLVVVAIRQGRAIRRLEERLARNGDAAVEASLQRIAELQSRNQTSSGMPSLRGQLRLGAALAVTALVLVAVAGGVWYLFVRDDGGGSASANTPSATTEASKTTANPPKPVDTTLVPANVPPIDSPSLYSVAVFNASGVTGAASNVIAPKIELEGYSVPVVDNPPDGASDRRESVVMWSKGNKKVAWNIAKLLGIRRAPPIDGYTPDQVGDADVVVLIGQDIANGTTASSP
jgi:hypothetical protein